jgi:hypothetical protein
MMWRIANSVPNSSVRNLPRQNRCSMGAIRRKNCNFPATNYDGDPKIATRTLARIDVRSATDVGEAIRRGKVYADACAEGRYMERLRGAAELKRVERSLEGLPLATTMMEGRGRMPWVSPDREPRV